MITVIAAGRWCAAMIALAALSGCATATHRELRRVVQNGKYGFIDRTGVVAIPPRFEWADNFAGTYATAYVCERYVSIDRAGNIAPLRLEGPAPFPATRKGKTGFVDGEGRYVIAASYDDALPFSEGLAAVKIGELWGFIDRRGRVAIPPQFKGAFYFHDDVAVVSLDDVAQGLINRTGQVVAQGYLFVEGVANEGLVPAHLGGKSGYLDRQGNVAIPLTFDQVSTYSEGLAAVRRDGKWGYIDRRGRTVIPAEYDAAGDFAGGLAPARRGATTGVINRSGEFAFTTPGFPAGFFRIDERTGMWTAPGDVSSFYTDDKRFGYVNRIGAVIWGPTEQHPDHRPLIDWSEEQKRNSCEGISAAEKARIVSFPTDD